MANKVDLKERRVVKEEEGRKFASSKDLEYFECSAVSCRMPGRCNILLDLQ